jgi:signal transduction histidine kinase
MNLGGGISKFDVADRSIRLGGFLLLAGLFFVSACNRQSDADIIRINGLLLRGISLNDCEQYDSARACFAEALKIRGGREEQGGRVLVNFGNSYYFQERYDEALKYYYEALRVAEKEGDKYAIARAAGNMSECFFMLGNETQALHYSDYSEQLIMQTTDTFIYLRAQVLYIKGSVLLERGELDVAEMMMRKVICISDSCYRKSIAAGITTGSGNLWYVAYGQEGLSKIALSRNDFDMAEDFAKQSIATAEKGAFPSVKAKCLTNLSSIYLKMKDYKKCLLTADEALATSSYIIKTEPVLAHNMAVANMFLGNSEVALNYADIYSSQMKKHTAKNFRETIASMATQYETDKKQLHIEVLEQRQYFLLALIVTGVGLTVAVWIILHQKIAREKREKQLVAVNAVLDGEKRERERLARDLHDELGGLLAALKLKTGRNEHFAAQEIDACIDCMRRIVHGLYPVALARFGLKIALDDFCSSNPQVRFYFFGNDSRLDSRTELVVYYSAFELINNSVRHSGASEINVQLVQSTDRISLTVQDNGCGFNPAAVRHGMGLKNLNDRIVALDGTIEMTSAPGQGTETMIVIGLPT